MISFGASTCLNCFSSSSGPLRDECDLAGIDLVPGDRQDDVTGVNETAENGDEQIGLEAEAGPARNTRRRSVHSATRCGLEPGLAPWLSGGSEPLWHSASASGQCGHPPAFPGRSRTAMASLVRVPPARAFSALPTNCRRLDSVTSTENVGYSGRKIVKLVVERQT